MLHPSDRQLIFATLLLLLLQMGLLFSDSYWWPGEGWVRTAVQQSQNEIGHVVHTQQKVKKRNLGSVVWEDTAGNDTLLNHDSVMTLEGSSAEIQLNNKVQLQLHENTLVVLEPDEQKESGALRLRFSRGTFLSTNPAQEITIENEHWQIHAAPGSKLSLKALDKNDVEVEVIHGAVQVGDEKQAIQDGTRFVVNNQKVKEVEIFSNEIKFEHKAEERIYTHDPSVPFQLRWLGAVTQIRWIQNGISPEIISLDKPAQDYALTLNLGTHYFRLINDQKASSELRVRILKAPVIRYTSPLPRDRFALGGNGILFGWIPVDAAVSYELSLVDSDTHREMHPAKHNTVQVLPKLEGEVQMKVYGVDSDGFKIPPAYSLPVFMIHDPLAAPVLNTPVERVPAAPPEPPPQSPGAFLWNLLFPAAHAEKPVAYATKPTAKQVKLSWQPVPGADFYHLEISSESDFLKPDTIVKVDGTVFVWSNFEKKTYYWRVAAGANSGRMGLFSAPAQFDLTHLSKESLGEIAPGVSLVKPVVAVVIAPPEPPPKPIVEPPAPADVILPPQDWVWGVDTEFHMLHFTNSVKNDVDVSLSGFSDLTFATRVKVQTDLRRDYEVFIRYSRLHWEPEDKTGLRFQNEFDTNEISAHWLRIMPDGDIGWGLSAETVTTFDRVGSERVSPETSYLFGPAFSYSVQPYSELSYQGVGALVYGNSITCVKVGNILNYQVTKSSSYYLGGSLDLKVFFGSDSLSGFSNVFGLHGGYQW